MRIQQDRFQVFISHKHADKHVAEVFKAELEGLSPQIRCWVSGKDIIAAADWRREIRHGLGESHLLLLLFTTPALNWDWCLYEVGLFMRFDADDVSAVVCLFDPKGESPGPLANVQGVPANANRIRNSLLAPLMRETWRIADDWLKGPLAPGISDEALDAAADKMAEAFVSAMQKDEIHYPCHRLTLSLPLEANLDLGIPESAIVRVGYGATTGFTLSLFGQGEGAHLRTWGDIVTAIGPGYGMWRRQLDEHFLASCCEKLFDPLNEPLLAWPGDRRYRPVIIELRRSGRTGRPTEVTILLVREPDPRVDGTDVASNGA
jgi:hypothetical protein